MIEFPYADGGRSLFPQVTVRLASPDGGLFFSGLPAKVDTGADRTVIPLHLLRQLQLAAAGERRFEGAHGTVFTLPMYFVEMAIEGLDAFKLLAAASGNEDLMDFDGIQTGDSRNHTSQNAPARRGYRPRENDGRSIRRSTGVLEVAESGTPTKHGRCKGRA